MKREIKFRVWDNEENRFFKPIFEAYKGNLLDLSISMNGRFLRRTLEMPAEDESRFEGRYELLQFIGKKDKHANEIYDGDFDPDGNVVVWCDNCNGWEFGALDIPTNELCIPCHRCDGNFFFEDHINDFEVIGNICQNRKLVNEAT